MRSSVLNQYQQGAHFCLMFTVYLRVSVINHWHSDLQMQRSPPQGNVKDCKAELRASTRSISWTVSKMEWLNIHNCMLSSLEIILGIEFEAGPL